MDSCLLWRRSESLRSETSGPSLAWYPVPMRKPWMGHLVVPTFVLVLAGCHSSEPPAYPTWATPVPAYTPQAQSGNAFDAYALAATEIEGTAAKHLTRVSFYPDQRDSAMKACEGVLAKIAVASK